MSIYPLTGAPVVEAQEHCGYFVVDDIVVCRGSLPAIGSVEVDWFTEVTAGTVNTAASYYPHEITLYMLHDPQRLLARPIDVERSVVGETQYVADRVVACWGSGESLDDAIEDYEHNLIEAYEDLVNAEEPLSRLAQQRLELLRTYLEIPR